MMFCCAQILVFFCFHESVNYKKELLSRFLPVLTFFLNTKSARTGLTISMASFGAVSCHRNESKDDNKEKKNNFSSSNAFQTKHYSNSSLFFKIKLCSEKEKNARFYVFDIFRAIWIWNLWKRRIFRRRLCRRLRWNRKWWSKCIKSKRRNRSSGSWNNIFTKLWLSKCGQ